MIQIGKGEKLPEIPQDLSSEARDFLQMCLRLIWALMKNMLIFRIEPSERWNVCKLLKHPFITGHASMITEIRNSDLTKEKEERILGKWEADHENEKRCILINI